MGWAKLLRRAFAPCVHYSFHPRSKYSTDARTQSTYFTSFLHGLVKIIIIKEYNSYHCYTLYGSFFSTELTFRVNICSSALSIGGQTSCAGTKPTETAARGSLHHLTEDKKVHPLRIDHKIVNKGRKKNFTLKSDSLLNQNYPTNVLARTE